MKEFAKTLYKSKRWQQTRAEYMRSVGGLCEDCMANGIIKAGEIVHHITPLTPENISDPNIALNWGNLRLVCRDCHAKAHDACTRRYKVDEMGRVLAR